MSIAGDVPPDELAIVYAWMHRLSNDAAAAEEWAIDVVLRHRRQVGPTWLRRCDALTRLRYLSARVVLERRGTL